MENTHKQQNTPIKKVFELLLQLQITDLCKYIFLKKHTHTDTQYRGKCIKIFKKRHWSSNVSRVSDFQVHDSPPEFVHRNRESCLCFDCVAQEIMNKRGYRQPITTVLEPQTLKLTTHEPLFPCTVWLTASAYITCHLIYAQRTRLANFSECLYWLRLLVLVIAGKTCHISSVSKRNQHRISCFQPQTLCSQM